MHNYIVTYRNNLTGKVSEVQVEAATMEDACNQVETDLGYAIVEDVLYVTYVEGGL